MKKTKFLTVLLLSVIPFTACTKKQTIVTPYPSTSPNAGSAVDNSQNYDPYQQGTGANPAYYGNGATLSDDTSGFDTNTDPMSNTGNTQTSNNQSPGTGFDLGDDMGIPTDLPNMQPYVPPTNGEAGDVYALAGNLLVDQDSYIPSSIPYIGQLAPSKNQWQGVGVASNGTDIIISAFDISGFFKKGTVITMNANTGRDWKNIGSQWLGTKHPMDATVKGIAVDGGGKMYAIDNNKYIYSLTKTSAVLKVDAGISGGLDITTVSDGLVVSTSTGLKKFPYSTLNTGSEFAAGVVPTGGLCTDKEGNIYVVAGSSIKKITSTGTASDFVTDISNGVDVAVNDKGRVFVLTKDGIVMYDDKGKKLNVFGQGDFALPSAIAAYGTDLYVADTGSSYKDSQVIKYSIMSL